MISGCVFCFVVVVDDCGCCCAHRNCCCCVHRCWRVGKADLRSAFLVCTSASCAIAFAVRCVLFDFCMLLVLLVLFELFELGLSQPDFLFVVVVEGGGSVGMGEGDLVGEGDLLRASLRGGGDGGDELKVVVVVLYGSEGVDRCGVVAVVGGCDGGV